MSISEQIFWLILISLAVASVSWTLTQEEIFREAREFFADRSKSARTILEQKFYYMLTCEYCLSHWVTIFFLLLTGFWLLIDDFRGYLIAFFVTPWVANQFMSLYRRLRVGIKHENALAENEIEGGEDS
jgi:hypothetical protein